MTDKKTERLEKDATDSTTVYAQVAADALADMFHTIMREREKAHPGYVQRLIKRIESHQSIIRVTVDYDVDGPLSYLFFECHDDRDPQLLVDVTPRGVTRQ